MTTGNPAVDILIKIAAGITALGIILTAIGVVWRRAFRPLFRVIATAEEVLPVVLTIAQEFKANDGSSLRDTIEQIATNGKDELEILSKYTHKFRHDFLHQFTILAGHQEILTEEVEKLSRRVLRVEEEILDVKRMVDRRETPR